MDVGITSIRPTKHYLENHADVEWDLVIVTILSPTKTHPNKRMGKDRFTYIKMFKKSVIEVHTKNDSIENKVWVINAFRTKR
jgi:hypothetical protein